METEAQTETPPPPSEMGEATPASPLFLFMLWVPVFAVVAWGMMLLFGRRPWELTDPDPLGAVPPPPDEPEG